MFDNSQQVLQRLYSVGFIGIYNIQSSSFVFCHDGKDPDRDFNSESRILVHPCYWLALATTQSQLKLDEAEDINDEYDIEVTSDSKELRASKIESLLQDITKIDEGKVGAYEFETWALKSLKLLLAGSITNIEIHPNTNGLEQRDIVGTNLGETLFWKRILKDYETRQVIFEIKNYKDLGATEYRQINSYLVNDYGRFAFIVTRDTNNNLEKHKELSWAKDLYNNHRKVVIKLSTNFITKHLRKARNPQKHNAVDKELSTLLDTYVRKYFITKCK